jgi:hypothetical protein
MPKNKQQSVCPSFLIGSAREAGLRPSKVYR